MFNPPIPNPLSLACSSLHLIILGVPLFIIKVSKGSASVNI